MAILSKNGTAPPGASVTVYRSETLLLATIYSDNVGTPLTNPFFADGVTGVWTFFYDTAIDPKVYWQYGSVVPDPPGSGVYQQGSVVSGNLSSWVNNNIIGDSGFSVADIVAAAAAAILPIDLASADVTGELPFANLENVAAPSVLGRPVGGPPLAPVQAITAVPDTLLIADASGTSLSWTKVDPKANINGAFGNTQLKVEDTDASHTLEIQPGSNLAGNRVLSILTGDANRTLNLGAADSYTPVWSTVATPPALGDGTIVGAYTVIGLLYFFQIVLTIGSTSTMGTGAFTFTLPFNALNNVVFAQGVARDASTSGQYMGFGIGNIGAGLVVIGMPSVTVGTPGPGFKVDTPFTWAVGDTLTISGWFIRT